MVRKFGGLGLLVWLLVLGLFVSLMLLVLWLLLMLLGLLMVMLRRSLAGLRMSLVWRNVDVRLVGAGGGIRHGSLGWYGIHSALLKDVRSLFQRSGLLLVMLRLLAVVRRRRHS